MQQECTVFAGHLDAPTLRCACSDPGTPCNEFPNQFPNRDAATCILPAVLKRWYAEQQRHYHEPTDVHIAAHGRTDRGVHARQHPFYLKWKAPPMVDPGSSAATIQVPDELASAIVSALNAHLQRQAEVASSLVVTLRHHADCGQIIGKT